MRSGPGTVRLDGADVGKYVATRFGVANDDDQGPASAAKMYSDTRSSLRPVGAHVNGRERFREYAL